MAAFADGFERVRVGAFRAKANVVAAGVGHWFDSPWISPFVHPGVTAPVNRQVFEKGYHFFDSGDSYRKIIVQIDHVSQPVPLNEPQYFPKQVLCCSYSPVPFALLAAVAVKAEKRTAPAGNRACLWN